VARGEVVGRTVGTGSDECTRTGRDDDHEQRRLLVPVKVDTVRRMVAGLEIA
jgi:hypothetical protein